MHGVLVVDKPCGPTSAKVVNQVKRALGVRKVGHTGTLDPMATGVLPLCVGRATRIARWLLADDKAYEGELELGIETDTLDAEGRVVARDEAGAAAIGAGAVAAALASFHGESLQQPPMYSALKRDGVRLHELARRGEEVERPPRPIRVDAIELLGFESPRARFAVECSKGTYVRSLVADLGASLGCGAHLTALRRTRSGRFTLEHAIGLDELSPEVAARRLIAPVDALGHLPRVAIPESRVSQVSDGLPLRWEQISSNDEPLGLFRLVDPEGRLRAVAHLAEAKLVYDRVLPS